MTNNEEIKLEKEPRAPDFCIGGFKLWVYGREFPESHDYWDGNWINVVVRCTRSSFVEQLVFTA